MLWQQRTCRSRFLRPLLTTSKRWRRALTHSPTRAVSASIWMFLTSSIRPVAAATTARSRASSGVNGPVFFIANRSSPRWMRSSRSSSCPYNFGLILGALQSGKTTTALALQFAGPAVYLVTGQRVFPFYLTTSQNSHEEQLRNELTQFIKYYGGIDVVFDGRRCRLKNYIRGHGVDPVFRCRRAWTPIERWFFRATGIFTTSTNRRRLTT